MKHSIRLSKSVIGSEEIEAVNTVLKKEFLGMGEEVFQFENELSSYLGSPAVCVNSGTAALHLAIQACGIGYGDEILVQSMTYLASFQAISSTGAKPVPCEIDPKTCTINLKDAKNRLTKNTKAIMPVHYCGNPGDLNKIYEFAKNHKLRVIEDSAHAFGTIYNGKKIGSFGDICCFSFDGIKNITSGEGGAVISSDKRIISKVKDLRLLGVQKDSDNRYENKRTWDFDVNSQGWRYHMSNIMAAIGIEQLKKFEFFQSKRKSLAKQYVLELKNETEIKLIDIDYDLVTPHIFIIRVMNGKRDVLKSNLEISGIQTGIHYKPNHLLSYYFSNNLPVTESIYKEILTLPLHPDLSFDDVKFICKEIKKFIK
jgi:dTDP-4-amino-4,6-dideoxygalactose transaminase